MKAVFVNHCHPDMDHVCGLRVGRFANAMAARGHQIVVLCEALPGDTSILPPSNLESALTEHEWAKPFILACPPVAHNQIKLARDGVLHTGWRQIVIAASYLFHGGMFPDWQSGTAPYLPELSRVFEPDVVWGTFGNTDTWRLCQNLARQADCPWVADFKDNWNAFVPPVLRTLVARRYGDAAHMTVFSMAHCDQADEVFPARIKTILYSGVDNVADKAANKGAAQGNNQLSLFLTGSVYDVAKLRELIAGIESWTRQNQAYSLRLHYAGNDDAAVRTASDGTNLAISYEGYLTQDRLHAMQAEASANLYVYNPRCLLHHKALELLAQGRPILVFPGETSEVKTLASEIGGCLFACADETAVSEALDVIVNNPPQVPELARRMAFTWAARAVVLETVLQNAIADKGKGT